jgi:hypothetical protein
MVTQRQGGNLGKSPGHARSVFLYRFHSTVHDAHDGESALPWPRMLEACSLKLNAFGCQIHIFEFQYQQLLNATGKYHRVVIYS